MAGFVSNKDETVRMFDSPFLERMSHIHPATPLVAYGPVVLWFLTLGFLETSIFLVLAMVCLGLLVWTLLEYTMHRWVFHYTPKSSWGKRLHFILHGVHHDYPRDSTRLVLPLIVSAPLAIVFFFTFKAVFGPVYHGAFAGLVAGYVLYDTIHYATHHLPMKGRVASFLKAYHLKHHYANDHASFGVSSPIWDYVFGTRPKK